MQKILVIGTGGLAREFTDWFNTSYEIIAYYSNDIAQHNQYKLPGKHFSAAIDPKIVGTDLAALAIGDPAIKQKLYTELTQQGFKFPSLVHQSSVVAATAQLADGVIISPQCVVAANAQLATCTYLNFNCGIGHETHIGSFTQINPGAQIGGAVTVGTSVLVGSGATILQGLDIGDHSKIASGSIVFNNVIASSTVMGNPAKRLRAFEQETI